MSWTSEHTERLRELWDTGASASVIAASLNREFRDAGYTRNAIIGKADRLRLPKRSTEAQRIAARVESRRASAARPPKRPAPKGVMVLNPVKGGDVATAARIENMAARERPAENVRLLARAFAPLPGREPVPFGSRGCKWPTGGEGASMLQCGCERDGESPYCATHRAAATVPTTKPHELVRSLRRWAA